jgi:hypothetical protein
MTLVFRLLTKKLELVFYISLFLCFLLLAQTVFAATDQDQAAKKYGITFPVESLGNCADLASCKAYCEDPVNEEACVSFAKSKGFYKQDALEKQKDQILEKAKSVLGCVTEGGCKEFCEDPENRDKCDQFAKQNGLKGGHVEDPAKEQIIQKAKEVLGCESEPSCKEICSKEENRQKCTDFAKQAGLKGGEHKTGPGGCTSEETCKAYCSDPNHFKECSEFKGKGGSRGGFKGPGGCDSEESCRSYCQSHPNECRRFKEDRSQGNYENNSKSGNIECNGTPQECYDYCKSNPGKCQGFDPNSPRPKDGYNSSYNGSYVGIDKSQQETACKAGGGTCDWTKGYCYCQGYKPPVNSYNYNSTGTSGGNYSSSMTKEQQESKCNAGGGTCDWSSGICNCKGYTTSSGGTTTTTSGSSGSTTTTTSPTPQSAGWSRESQEAGCKACNGTCSWNGDFCSCQCGSTSTSSQPTQAPQATPYVDPATECQNSGGRWAGGQCYHDSVQGASTGPNLFQQLLHLVFGN